MSFTNPTALLLLLVLPIFVYVGWPRLPYRRRRDAASLLIRLVLVTLLILGLAGIQLEQVADKLAVVFLIDVSDSVPPEQQSAAMDYVRIAADAMSEKDQAAVIVFGADALVEIPMSDRLALIQMGSDPIRLNTDLAEAMRLGLALFPADTAKRMVILSDGKQTVGDAEEVARLAAATEVQVDYVYLPNLADSSQEVAEAEILVTDVQVPTTVNEGEEFDLTVTIASNRPGESLAEVRVLSSGRIIHQQDVVLREGTNTYIFPDIVVPTAGFVDFRVVVEPRSSDNFYQNNELSAFTQVTGPPRVLLVTLDEREVETLRAALTETGLQVDVQNPHDLPLGLAPLSSYDSIVLANVPATEISQERMEFLQAYVRDLGGGLVAIGGPNSYGVGGYFETPLEETLPVEMRIRDQERIPQLTMLYVIDRSGSMEMAGPSGVSNLELAKEAISRSFDLLNDYDRTGVISFDVETYFVLEIQDVGDVMNREAMRAQVGTLRPGGGTNIREGVETADLVLQNDPSQLKHIILLTDGGSDPAGIISTVNDMYENYGVTTSVVAIGQNYAAWLQDVAVAGRGQFHLAYDVSTIPAIFTAETLIATRSYISEEEFFPGLTARHPIVSGLDSTPSLLGYVVTTPKDTATVILRGPEDDPILAAWQYGLGRSVAFTSDASSRWAANWIGWDSYSDFWSQAIRWTIIEGGTSNVEAQVLQRGEEAVLVVDARDSQGNYLNGLALDASVINSQLDRQVLPLQQTAPGRYEAVFMPEREGSYFITVAGSTPGGSESENPQAVVQTTGWVLSYSAEYRVDVTGAEQEQPLAALRRITQITGGSGLGTQPEGAFSHDLNQQRAAQPVWPYFLLAVLLLLPIDVASRRLIVTRRDLVKAYNTLAERMGSGPAPAYETTSTSGRLERLRGAKDRARVPSQQDSESPGEATAVPSSSRMAKKRRAVRKAAPAPPSAVVQEKAPPSPTAQSGTLASRLLEKRRTTPQDEDKP